MESKASPFKLDEFLIQESRITRKPVEKIAETLRIDIKPVGVYHKESKVFQLTLDISVFEDNKRFEAYISAVGLFSFQELQDISYIDTYFYVNAPAILFPYVRSYPSALTALSGMEAVNLPPLVMAGLKDELKANTRQVE
jgi:preprotein translocase subunit SecB